MNHYDCEVEARAFVEKYFLPRVWTVERFAEWAGDPDGWPWSDGPTGERFIEVVTYYKGVYFSPEDAFERWKLEVMKYISTPDGNTLYWRIYPTITKTEAKTKAEFTMRARLLVSGAEIKKRRLAPLYEVV